MAESPKPPAREGGTVPRRLGRGLESLSPLLFSGGGRGAAPGGPGVPGMAAADAGSAGPDEAGAGVQPLFARPSTLLVTGYRAGCGKSFIASGIAAECGRGGVPASEWQLGPGVVVPRDGSRFALPVPHPSERESYRSWFL